MKSASRVDASVRGVLRAYRLSPSPTNVRNAHMTRRDLLKPAPTAQRQQRRGPKRSASCPWTSSWLLSTFLHHGETPACRPPLPKRRCSSGTATVDVPQDKEHLLSLVGGLDQATVEECLMTHTDPYRRRYPPSDGPKITVSERPQDLEYPAAHEATWANDSIRAILLRLYAAVTQRLRAPHRVGLEPIYKLYQQLPQPRMLYLTFQWRNRLLRVMGTPRKPQWRAMLRYFDLVADVKNAGLTLRRSQWNHALNLATKNTARCGQHEVDTVMRLWRRMELEAHIPGNDVTFNILFNVATKAGNFSLADTIFRQMEARGIEYNRYHYVSLIHYFGLKLDSDGLRAAYKEMVLAGEVIDTVVLNCVISGLLRCGEEAQAEETYARMRDSHAMACDLPQRSYMTNKAITKALLMFSRIGKQHPKLLVRFQASVHIVPDLHTYKLLVQHYTIRLGSLSRVAKLLDEMKFFKVSVHPTIFLVLFKGFYMHGGLKGTEWSALRLEGVLEALYAVHDTYTDSFRLERWVVIWALRAVRRCEGPEALKLHFEKLRRRWCVPETREAALYGTYENILEGRDLKAASSGWDETLDWRVKKDGLWV